MTSPDRIEHVALGNVPLDQRRQIKHQRQVAFDIPNDVRPADLDRDPRPVMMPRPVHLTERTCGERLALEFGEQFLDRFLELDFQTMNGLLGGKRRDRFLQVLEFGDDVGRDEVRTRAHYLAELDERRPEFLQRHPDPLGGRVVLGDLRLSLPQNDPPTPLDVPAELQPLQQITKAVIEQDSEDFAAAAEIAEEAQRMSFQRCLTVSPGGSAGQGDSLSATVDRCNRVARLLSSPP